MSSIEFLENPLSRVALPRERFDVDKDLDNETPLLGVGDGRDREESEVVMLENPLARIRTAPRQQRANSGEETLMIQNPFARRGLSAKKSSLSGNNDTDGDIEVSTLHDNPLYNKSKKTMGAPGVTDKELNRSLSEIQNLLADSSVGAPSTTGEIEAEVSTIRQMLSDEKL